MTLELRNVTKRVGAETLIYPTNLTLEPGSFNILLGTTLAGKTTMMQLMAGLDRPTEGAVWFNGVDTTGMRVQKRNVSMVYQQFINYPNMSVYENIASPLRVARAPKDVIDRRVGEMAELLKLTAMLDRRPDELSGGQQQRTALARALIKDSDLVLLDEPLANLDFKLREELREELPRLFANRDAIVVYATTEPVEALLFGGHTATLFEGRVTQFGPTGELYRHPDDLVTAQVFSDPPINMASVRKSGPDFKLGDAVSWTAIGASRALGDGDYKMGVRPYHITPVAKGELPVPIEGQVLVTELSGSESIIHLAVGDAIGGDATGGETANGETTWISVSQGIHPFEVGSRARLYIDMSKAMFFDADDRLIASQAPVGDSDAGNGSGG